MSEKPQPSQDATTSSAVRRIKMDCDRFEAAWTNAGARGQRPRIEDYLKDTPEAERLALLTELIALDMDYRQRAGEQPHAEDYHGRFPFLDQARIAGTLAGGLAPDAGPASPPSGRQTGSVVETGKPAGPPATRIRCPNCHNPIDLADDRPDEVLCPGCGSSFRVREARQTSTEASMRPLGKFQLMERVGLGAFGAVWRAKDIELDRVVALKIPHASLLQSEADLERFHREARAAAQLRHPGIVTVHEVQVLEGLPTIVSDFIDGVSLRDFLEVRKLTFPESALLLAEVAEAVDYAHSMGLVHRDIKPANIMVDRSHVPVGNVASGALTGEPRSLGRPLIMDFGLALRQEAEVTLTVDGHIIGTPAYMSPEQASGKGHQADQRSDVYSLGVILYELLTAELPFRGSKMMILHQVLSEEPRPPRRVNDKIPRDLETICLKALNKEPGRRYQTARALAEELRRWLRGEPIKERPTSAWERGWKWAKRRPAVAALSGLVFLVAVVGFALVFWQWLRAESKVHEAEGARLQAERNLVNFHQAVKAFDHMLNRVGMERLAGLLQTEEERKEFLEDILNSYDVFLHEDSDDREDRHVMGLACQRTASLYRLLGKREEAKKRYVQGVKLQEALVKQFPDSSDYRHDLAVTRLELGDLLQAAGQNSDAETLYEEARRSLLEPWAREPRADPVYQKTLAAILNSLGELYAETNRKEAAQVLKEALDLRKRMEGSHPSVADYQQALARSHNSLGRLYINLGQKAKGEEAHRTALKIQERLVRDQPAVPDYQIDLATTFIDLGWLYRDDIRIEDAMAAFEAAHKIRSNLARVHPHIPDYQHDLAQSDFHLGVVHFQANRHTEATEAFQRALAILEPLVKNSEHNIKFAISLANVYQAVGDFMKDTKRQQPALEMYSRSILILKGVLDKEPLHVGARKWLSYTHMFQAENLIRMVRRPEAIKDWQQIVELSKGQSNAHLRVVRAIALARLDDHARAAEEVRDMIQHNLRPSATVGTYNFACVFSICSEAVLSDPKLLPAEQKEQAKTYQDSAMKHLMSLRDTGLFTSDARELLWNDPDLEPLRQSCDDFKKLLHQLEEEKKQKSSKGKNGARD